MLEVSRASTGLLFFSFLFRSDLFTEDLFQNKVQNLFGKLIVFHPQINPLSVYYSKEMGHLENLRRVFYVSTETYPREFLLSSKLLALDWEREWVSDNSRMVNVDTGFLSLENFLLATTKNFSHRIFIGQNQFADLTYQFVDQSFQCLPWTYPDFKDPEKLEFFNWCRSFLLMHSKVVQS